MRWMILVLASCVLLTGCNKTIQQEYRKQLSQLRPGTSTLADFQAIMPDAYRAAQNTEKDGSITDAYEVTYTRLDVPAYANDREQTLWFYFNNDKLVKWGRPNDWQQPPDYIEERRQR